MLQITRPTVSRIPAVVKARIGAFRARVAGIIRKHLDLTKALGLIIFGAVIPLVIYFLGDNQWFLNPARANTAVSIAVIGTYPLVMYWPNVSVVAALGKHLRQDESWRGKNSEEARIQARSLIPVSGTVAGISLATIALATRLANRNQLEDINAVIGVGLMLFSSILLFWSLGMWFTASVPIRAEVWSPKKEGLEKLNAVAARQGYWLITLGIYTYFLGLVWVLSPLNLWFTLVGALTNFHRLLDCYSSAIQFSEGGDKEALREIAVSMKARVYHWDVCASRRICVSYCFPMLNHVFGNGRGEGSLRRAILLTIRIGIYTGSI